MVSDLAKMMIFTKNIEVKNQILFRHIQNLALFLIKKQNTPIEDTSIGVFFCQNLFLNLKNSILGEFKT
jgi:hypothetical protein